MSTGSLSCSFCNCPPFSTDNNTQKNYNNQRKCKNDPLAFQQLRENQKTGNEIPLQQIDNTLPPPTPRSRPNKAIPLKSSATPEQSKVYTFSPDHIARINQTWHPSTRYDRGNIKYKKINK